MTRPFSYTRAYLHAVIKESAACHMITVHNVAFQLRLMRNVRESIISGKGFLQPLKCIPDCMTICQ